jgi:hypothetical protein
LCTTSRAQGNLTYIDGKFIHFGFSLGFNALDFGVTPSRDSIGGKVYNADVSSIQPGFSVGIISDIRLNRYLNLRFTPTLHFGARTLTYTTDNGATKIPISISSIPISLPLYLKYSAERTNNFRPYLIWGGGAAIDLSTDQSKPILLKPLNFYTEFGVGCDIYFSFFKLAPELKFALGFNDIMNHNFIPSDPTNSVYTQAISKLTSRMLTLTFNFE